MRKYRAALMAALALCGAMIASGQTQTSQSQQRYALLIGIGNYSHPQDQIARPADSYAAGRFDQMPLFDNLQGPPNDLKTMHGLLKNFGFTDDDAHIYELHDPNTKRADILTALRHVLLEQASAGDMVVLYVSSHGSLRANPGGDGPAFNVDIDGTGLKPVPMENTIVPYDWYTGANDVFSRDFRHLFKLAADRHVYVTAIFDSCHSGGLSRDSKKPRVVPKDFALDPRPMPANEYPEQKAEVDQSAIRRQINEFVLVLSAAQEDQTAAEVDDGPNSYGLFTRALKESLEALPPDRPASDVFKRLQVSMELIPDAAHQQPAMTASEDRAQIPLFGGRKGSYATTATVSPGPHNDLIVNIGAAADIGPGSVFTEIPGRPPVTITVGEPIGMARSHATATSGKASPGDIVQLKQWVPAQRPQVMFYAGTPPLPMPVLSAAVAALCMPPRRCIADPGTEDWNFRITWDGRDWIMEPHLRTTAQLTIQRGAATRMGATLNSGALKKIPDGSAVWFDAPPTADLAPAILAPVTGDQPARPAVLTSDRTQALYILAGTVAQGQIQYAWYKRGDYDDQVKQSSRLGAGCSPGSPFPLRTDWFPAGAATASGAALTDFAVRIAKLNGWLQIASSTIGGQESFPYHVGLQPAGSTNILGDGDPVAAGSYNIVLTTSRTRNVKQRWVYVLDIDCQGNATLQYPTPDVPAAKWPKDQGAQPTVVVTTTTFDEPLDSETYILLTTTTQLANTSALGFAGVVGQKGVAGRQVKAPRKPPVDALEQLLDDTSDGSVGSRAPTPTSWGIELAHFHGSQTAHPQPAAGTSP